VQISELISLGPSGGRTSPTRQPQPRNPPHLHRYKPPYSDMMPRSISEQDAAAFPARAKSGDMIGESRQRSQIVSTVYHTIEAIKLWKVYLFFGDSEELDDSIAPCMPMALISCSIMSRTLVDKASTSAAVSPSVGMGSNTIMNLQLDAPQVYKGVAYL